MDFNSFKIGKQANSATVELGTQEEQSGFSSYKVASATPSKGGIFNPENGKRIYQSCSGTCNTQTGHFVIGNIVICTICNHEYKI